MKKKGRVCPSRYNDKREEVSQWLRLHQVLHLTGEEWNFLIESRYWKWLDCKERSEGHSTLNFTRVTTPIQWHSGEEPALIDEIRREGVVPARSHQAVRRLPGLPDLLTFLQLNSLKPFRQGGLTPSPSMPSRRKPKSSRMVGSCLFKCPVPLTWLHRLGTSLMKGPPLVVVLRGCFFA